MSRPRRLRCVLCVLCALVLLAGCALDEAELYRAGSPQITADVGQLRVLSHDDDPATDDWIDVVTPDPAVFDEGDPFREADSRTAEDDQPAEIRRLFTGVAEGRTLLVRLDRGNGEVLVWDLVVGGDVDDGFSDGTAALRADRSTDVEVGDHFTVVRDDDGEATFVTDDDAPVELVGRHETADGPALAVDVFVALAPGSVDLVYGDETYPVTVG